MPKGNQHNPIPPDEDLHPWVEYYWRLGFSDKDIVEHVLDHFDKSQFGFSIKSLQRARTKLGLQGTRQQKASFETIAPFIEEIRQRFPMMGARQMVTTMRQDYTLKVPELTIARFLKKTEPEAVARRKAQRFRRKRFWAAGVMDIITCDQHDKWK